MKHLFIAVLIIMHSGCVGGVNRAMSQHQDWEFMESVGGLSVAGQDQDPDWLVVRADVSGLTQYSTKPTAINSALVVMALEKRITESNIQIYVVTTVVSEKYPSSVVRGVNISGIKKGRYMVQYLNPDGSVIDLKEVEIY